MFSVASKQVRKSVYGFLATSVVGQNGPRVSMTASNGTAFMVAPGYLVTAAHSIHQDTDTNKPVHQNFEIVCTVDIGKKMEKATFVAEDISRDIALLRIDNAVNSDSVTLLDDLLSRGTSCGFLGFPLANVQFLPNGQRSFNLFERFQGAYISNYLEINKGQKDSKAYYEIDTLMYSGSSGCPAFNVEGKVVGMQVASVMQKRTEDNQTERIAISLVVPSTEILKFTETQKIDLSVR
jgi:S1-C subfamily serine protease